MIELYNLQKRYGRRTVLDISALSFEPGVRYALIGQNGCGKTTLLRLLAGTLAPDGGQIAGVDLKTVGYLPQQPYAFDLSVLHNVTLALKNDREAQAKAMAMLGRLGLESLANARAARLSGGECQRMALARLLVKPWRLLLLDEPTSAADLRAGELIEAVLRDYARETGCTLVFASHAPGLAKRLSQRVVALDNGRVAETGLTEAVFTAPSSPVTQAFLDL